MHHHPPRRTPASGRRYGSEDFHGAVRRPAVEHMQREREFFGAMFEEAGFEAYLADVRRRHTVARTAPLVVARTAP